MNTPIVINGVSISINRDGLYRLNDVHAGSPVASQDHKKPSQWARAAGTEIIAAAEAQSDISTSGTKSKAYVVINGGNAPGTYACRELVISYSMWLNAEFALYVIRVFDAVINGVPKFNRPNLQYIYSMMLEQEQMERRITALEGETRGHGFFSVLGWSKLRNIRVNEREASLMGKEASRRCRQRGIQRGSVSHAKWGRVGTYPIEILDELYAELPGRKQAWWQE